MPDLAALRSAVLSDVGRQREVNEDAFVHEPTLGIFAVIDGMGGYAGGDVAAGEARQALLERMNHRTGSPRVRLREAVVLANNRIYKRAQAEPEHAAMACVLTAAVVAGDRLYAAHVGDTRLYKIHGGKIEKLTSDHSVIGVREDAGQLSERQAMQHPRRNEVLRDVGSFPHIADDPAFIESLETPFEPDAAFVLCSDGLTDLVTRREIFDAVTRHAGDPGTAAHHLIDCANERGGTDNITVLLIEGPAFAPPAEAKKEGPAQASSWSYFWGGVATSLLVAFIGLSVWGMGRGPEPPPEPPPLDRTVVPDLIGVPFLLPDSGAVTFTPGVYLRDSLTLEASARGLQYLARPDSLAPADTFSTGRRAADSLLLLRGFVIVPDTAEAGTYAVGVFVERGAGTHLRLLLTLDSLKSAADSLARNEE